MRNLIPIALLLLSPAAWADPAPAKFKNKEKAVEKRSSTSDDNDPIPAPRRPMPVSCAMLAAHLDMGSTGILSTLHTTPSAWPLAAQPGYEGLRADLALTLGWQDVESGAADGDHFTSRR